MNVFGYNEYAQDTACKVDLRMTTNPLGMSPKSIRLVKQYVANSHNYYYENKELLEAISERCGINPAEILLGDGSDGVLTLCARAFFKEKRVLTPDPDFPRYDFYVDYGLGKHGTVRVFKDKNMHYDKLLYKKADVLMLSSPNTPTGIPAGIRLVKEALDSFELVILDEAQMIKDSGFTKLLRDYGNLIIARSFSKFFGLAGLRVGYGIAMEKSVELLRSFSSPFKVNMLGQLAALGVLKDEKYLQRTVQHAEEELMYLAKELPDSTASRSKALGYVVRVNEAQKNELDKQGIGVTRGSRFRGLGSQYIRVSVGTRGQNRSLVSALQVNNIKMKSENKK